MSDWIKHNGGPQPVADDVEVQVIDKNRLSWTSFARKEDWDEARQYRILNQHLIDAARLEGIRLGLEAAHAALWSIAIGPYHSDEDWEDAIGVTELIRALDPETIAREAQGER